MVNFSLKEAFSGCILFQNDKLSIDSDRISPAKSAVLQGVGADRSCVPAPQWVGVQGVHVAPSAFQIFPTLPAGSEGGAVHEHTAHFSEIGAEGESHGAPSPSAHYGKAPSLYPQV